MLVNRKIVGTVGAMLGLPSVLSDWAWSFAKMVNFNSMYVCDQNTEINYIKSPHSFHAIARNEMAANAMGHWLFMLDCDHSFEPDLLFRMLNAMNKFDADVVSALYLHRSWPYSPTIWKWLPDRDYGHSWLGDWPPNEVLEVDCTGGGSLLIKLDVIKRIYDELGEDPFSTEEYSRGGRQTGEDFAFFRRLQKLGIKAICPTYIQCNHLMVKPLDYDKDYDRAGALEQRMFSEG